MMCTAPSLIRPVALAGALIIGLPGIAATADLHVTNVFGDHMVIQRGMPVPVRGRAKVGDHVTVEFAGQQKTATMAVDGS